MKRIVLLALLASTSAGFADTVTTASDRSAKGSAIRNETRGGSYASEWSGAGDAHNLKDHEGRSAGTFEDGGRGKVEFEVKAGADGKAVIDFQDVGDTRNMKNFKVNGEKVAIPKPRADGSILRVVVDFGRSGWQKVVAATTLRGGGSHAGRQDGFSVCRR